MTFTKADDAAIGSNSSMASETPAETEHLNHRVVRYFHDCLAAQTDWGRAVNVIEQKDVSLLPFSAQEQRRFGADGDYVVMPTRNHRSDKTLRAKASDRRRVSVESLRDINATGQAAPHRIPPN